MMIWKMGHRSKFVLFGVLLFWGFAAQASMILIPMDETQTNHLKAYGITFWALEREIPAEWLLNYRGGSFLLPNIE